MHEKAVQIESCFYDEVGVLQKVERYNRGSGQWACYRKKHPLSGQVAVMIMMLDKMNFFSILALLSLFSDSNSNIIPDNIGGSLARVSIQTKMDQSAQKLS
jgi:hypothetical protein